MKMLSGFILVFALVVLSSCSKEFTETNLTSNGPVDGVELKSASNDTDLEGNWLFVGYQTEDGIDLDGELTPQENANLRIMGEKDNLYSISGKSFINNFFGSINFDEGSVNLSDLAQTLMIDFDEIVVFEMQFINSLLSASSFDVDGDILIIEADLDTMIFVKDTGSVEPNVVSNDPLDDVDLISNTNGTDLDGNWLFVGYQTLDGIDINGELTPQDNANLTMISETDNVYAISGKSFINNYLGTVDFNGGGVNLSDLAQTLMIDMDEIVILEMQFINSLLSATSFDVNGDILIVEVDNDHMIFVKDSGLGETDTVSNEPWDDVELISNANDSDLEGNWLFVGYQTLDGIDINGELTPQENANLTIIGGADNVYTISGKSFINNYLGTVDFDGEGVNLSDFAQTLAIDIDEIVILEIQFINSLLSATSFDASGDILIIEVDNDHMVFVKG